MNMVEQMNGTRTDVQIERATVPVGISESDYRLCVRAALLYYRDGLSQSEIGARLGYSRIKINRVLGKARSYGILHLFPLCDVLLCPERADDFTLIIQHFLAQ